MIYRIQNHDELYHYGVKGMRWGVRHDPERSGNSHSSRKGMSTAKKVAIGVGVAAAVAGATYVGVKAYRTNNYNKIAKSAVQRALKQHGKRVVAQGGNIWDGPRKPTQLKRGPSITGHSRYRMTKPGAAIYRDRFYRDRAQKTPLTYDYMTNPNNARRKLESKANSARDEYLRAYQHGGRRAPTQYRYDRINKLTRKKKVFG